MSNHVVNDAYATIFVMVSDDKDKVNRLTDEMRMVIPPHHPNLGLKIPALKAQSLKFQEMHPGEKFFWDTYGRTMYITIILHNAKLLPDSVRILCDTLPNSSEKDFIVKEDEQLYFLSGGAVNNSRAHSDQSSSRQSSSGNSTPGPSAHAAGQRILKSCHGSYLRAHNSDKVDMTSGSAQAWEHWYVEDWKGKVVFKAIHSPGRFIRAHPDGDVELVMSHPKSWETWVPYKNDDGSWSFRSFHGKWLTAHANGFVNSEDNRSSSDHFWLSHW